MLELDGLEPGEWPTLTRAGRRRLTWLAERYLIGWPHAAEDVVVDACVKWAAMKPRFGSRPRLEQVVKTTAISWSRSEQRRLARQGRHIEYAGAERSNLDQVSHEMDLRLMVQEVTVSAVGAGLRIDDLDRLILRLLLDGESMAEVSRRLGCGRSRVRTSRLLWQRAWAQYSRQAGEQPFL